MGKKKFLSFEPIILTQGIYPKEIIQSIRHVQSDIYCSIICWKVKNEEKNRNSQNIEVDKWWYVSKREHPTTTEGIILKTVLLYKNV